MKVMPLQATSASYFEFLAVGSNSMADMQGETSTTQFSVLKLCMVKKPHCFDLEIFKKERDHCYLNLRNESYTI
jgi:hypothetical protein